MEKRLTPRNKATTRWRVRKLYGLELDDYLSIMENGSHCEICGHEFTEADPLRFKNLDHDHVTGKIRGVLCSHCNMALGQFRDDPERLIQALEYLERFEGGDSWKDK